MKGQDQRSGAGDDSFWTWREVMYRYLERLQPHHLEAIAAQLTELEEEHGGEEGAFAALDKINKEVEKSTLGDLDALSALKDKMEDAGKKTTKAKKEEK